MTLLEKCNTMNEKLRKILILLCAAVIIGSAAVILRNIIRDSQKRNLDQQVREMYGGENAAEGVLGLLPGAEANPDAHPIPTPVGAKPVTDEQETAAPAEETAAPEETSAVGQAETSDADHAAAPAAADAAPAVTARVEQAPSVDALRDQAAREGELSLPYAMETEELPPVHPDFSKLLEANKDTIGWLKLPGMVDLPVMYRDNDYYLDNNFFCQADNNGTLFLNMHNMLYPRDDVLLIHGHHMNTTGAMFGYLPRYGDFAYVKEHPLAYFRTIYDGEDQVYVPVAAFTASMKEDEPDFFDIMQLSFGSLPGAPADGSQTLRNSPEFQQYLQDIAGLSRWKSPVDVNVDDQLLMLVTCVREHNDGRFMLLLRRLRPGETEERVRKMFQGDDAATTATATDLP